MKNSNDGCLQGGFEVKRINPADELMVMNDFQSNVNLVINGETLTQNQLVEKLYYQGGYQEMQNNKFVVNKQPKPFKKEIEIPETPKPLEPGQVDPATFFGSSLKGLI
jgi:hypothetical protein